MKWNIYCEIVFFVNSSMRKICKRKQNVCVSVSEVCRWLKREILWISESEVQTQKAIPFHFQPSPKSSHNFKLNSPTARCFLSVLLLNMTLLGGTKQTFPLKQQTWYTNSRICINSEEFSSIHEYQQKLFFYFPPIRFYERKYLWCLYRRSATTTGLNSKKISILVSADVSSNGNLSWVACSLASKNFSLEQRSAVETWSNFISHDALGRRLRQPWAKRTPWCISSEHYWMFNSSLSQLTSRLLFTFL